MVLGFRVYGTSPHGAPQGFALFTHQRAVGRFVHPLEDILQRPIEALCEVARKGLRSERFVGGSWFVAKMHPLPLTDEVFVRGSARYLDRPCGASCLEGTGSHLHADAKVRSTVSNVRTRSSTWTLNKCVWLPSVQPARWRRQRLWQIPWSGSLRQPEAAEADLPFSTGGSLHLTQIVAGLAHVRNDSSLCWRGTHR
jgi:hypothetical protein